MSPRNGAPLQRDSLLRLFRTPADRWRGRYLNLVKTLEKCEDEGSSPWSPARVRRNINVRFPPPAAIPGVSGTPICLSPGPRPDPTSDVLISINLRQISCNGKKVRKKWEWPLPCFGIPRGWHIFPARCWTQNVCNKCWVIAVEIP